MEGGTGDLEALLAEKQQAAHQQALTLRKERKRLAKELEQQILTELKNYIWSERNLKSALQNLSIYKKMA